MTWTGDPVWLADVLRAEGVKVVEAPGWKDWGNGDFGTIWGVIWHHTGGNNSPVDEIRYGTSSLKGLLSQIHLAKDGTATLCGVGTAYHAGRGSYPGLPTNNANAVTIGVEMVNDGFTPYTQAQKDAAVLIGTAISRKLETRADRNIGHLEYAGDAQGKWDPSVKLWSMPDFRKQIQARLDKQEAPVGSSEVKQVQDFVAGFCGPIGADVKDIREQLTGGRDGGEYPGWQQLGNRTVVDALAIIGEHLGIVGFSSKAGK